MAEVKVITKLKDYTSGQTDRFVLTEYDNTKSFSVSKDKFGYWNNGSPFKLNYDSLEVNPNHYMHFKLELTNCSTAIDHIDIEITEILGDNFRQCVCQCKKTNGYFIDFGANVNIPHTPLYYTYLKIDDNNKVIEGVISHGLEMTKGSIYVKFYDANNNLVADTSFFDNRPPTIIRSGLKFDYTGEAKTVEGITNGASRVGFGVQVDNNGTLYNGYNLFAHAHGNTLSSPASVCWLNGGTTKDADFSVDNPDGTRADQREPIYYITISGLIPKKLFDQGYRFDTTTVISKYYTSGTNEYDLNYSISDGSIDSNYTYVEYEAQPGVKNKTQAYVLTGDQKIANDNAFVRGSFYDGPSGHTYFSMELRNMTNYYGENI